MRNNETTNITLDKHESLKTSKKLFIDFGNKTTTIAERFQRKMKIELITQNIN